MNEWWSKQNGYFGDFYIRQDTLREGEDSITERTEREVSGIEKLLELENGDRILDCPCGYGRHSIELSLRGYKVMGVDLNRRHLNKARQDDINNNVIFKEQNMLDVDFSFTFDAVVNVFASFGFFDTQDKDKIVLRNFYRSLTPGGRLLIHVDVNLEKLLKSTSPHENVKKIRNGESMKIQDKYNHETKRIEGIWTIKDGQNIEYKNEYSVRIYDVSELTKMCEQIGFKKVVAYGDWSGHPYKQSSNDMIVVAYK